MDTYCKWLPTPHKALIRHLSRGGKKTSLHCSAFIYTPSPINSLTHSPTYQPTHSLSLSLSLTLYLYTPSLSCSTRVLRHLNLCLSQISATSNQQGVWNHMSDEHFAITPLFLPLSYLHRSILFSPLLLSIPFRGGLDAAHSHTVEKERSVSWMTPA